jgi:hypothetical protein
VPDASRRVGHFITYKPNAIVSRIWLDLVYGCACPRNDGWLHSHCVTGLCKCETGDATDGILAIGGIVIHVALSGMGLAPDILMGGDILRFSKIGRAGVKVCVQIVDLNQNPVGYAVVHVPVMVV